jgi:hypothetical protein
MESDFLFEGLKSMSNPTKEELEAEGAKYTQSKAAGAYPGYRKNSEETKRKISESLKGNVPWNAGKKGLQTHSEETREKMRLSHLKYETEEERIAARRESYRKQNEKRKLKKQKS